MRVRAPPEPGRAGRPLRHTLIAAALACGAAPAFAPALARAGRPWREVRERSPQGVASGEHGPDPRPHLDAQAAHENGTRARLMAELAEDVDFRRVLVVGLQPSRSYWYRFTDD